MKPVVVIPAYKPDNRLPRLIQALSSELRVVVVDDGSGPEYAGFFHKLKSLCAVSAHSVNRGKGAALKTGIREVKRLYPETIGIVTADADGQHTPEDILRVAEALETGPDALILGVRSFSEPSVPAKSKIGNRVTSAAFRLVTGVRCLDTQTGLRGFSMAFAETALDIPGERFEYEFHLLLHAVRSNVPLREVAIQTVYFDGNRATRFRAVRDSARVFAGFLRFGASSLCSALADISLFSLFSLVFSWGILASTVLARLLSGALNFTMNQRWVFRGKNGDRTALLRYAALFIGQMLTSWLLVTALAELLPLTIAKVLVDLGLFAVSYYVQKNVVFRLPHAKGREGMTLINTVIRFMR
ncbi:MAG: bifunctional glycosyltransferase family 2/GtrA family protein, partial [Oscillospiraceae bacterium]|nr:bifunctional glycosyltransferase family 2/GtrA family protein [Oscillospiraceae bacterium]